MPFVRPMKDIFDKIPPHGLFHGWLGSESVDRLLKFIQSNEHLFVDTSVTYDDSVRIDPTRRVSKKLDAGYLKTELKAKLTDVLPVILDRLSIKVFIPQRIEVELVAHGEGAFFERHSDITHTGRQRVI